MPDDTTTLRFTVNDAAVEIHTDPGAPLVDVLREQLAMNGLHVGCRNGDCGACTVLVDGAPYKSCLVPCGRASNRRLETLDGLARDGQLHPVQKAFWDANAFQCGYCLAGHVLCTVALLRENPRAGLPEIEAALAGNLCRCTGYQQIVAAVLVAVEQLREAEAADGSP